jgi:hypothetical protein
MKKLILLICLLGYFSIANSQIKYEGSFGKGIRFETNDGTFGLKFATRIQPRWDFDYNVNTNTYVDRMKVKRARLKFDGFFINKNLRYKIEYDVVGGYVRDAVIKYRFSPKWDLWFGQTKLPGNRERIVSSGNLQLVDRSLFNGFYSLDRDLGLQLRNEFTLGKMVIRDMVALSAGNGILNLKRSNGVDVTGKVEVLPLGKFTNKGDFIGSDIYREDKLKISLAFGANYNMKAYKSNGQVGLDTQGEADLFMIFGDILLKYKGISLMVEAANRITPNASSYVSDSEGTILGAFYTGWGMNFQGGYVFKSMWEVSGRYAFTNPNLDYYKSIHDHTIGISRFIVGHKFKVQTDFTYRTTAGSDDIIIGRLQMEIHF